MIRIALTDLGRYNNGELVFEWVDLPVDDFEEVMEQLGNPEEYFISDYECDIPHMVIHEYENLDELNNLAIELECMSTYEKMILAAIMEADGSPIDEALETLEAENYMFYATEDFEEFIDLFIEDGFFGEIPEEMREFLDYEKLTHYFQDRGFHLTSTGVINTF